MLYYALLIVDYSSMIVSLSVEAIDTVTVTVVEGDNVNISCIASANPLPSAIVWSFSGVSTSFTQTDTTEDKTVYVPSEGEFSFSEGNKTSTLHVTAAEYPTHSGIYTCSSSTDTATLNDTITVEVLGGHFLYHSNMHYLFKP